MNASSPQFLIALRQATRPAHKSLETMVDAQRLMSTRPELAHYQRLLSAQYLLHKEVARHISKAANKTNSLSMPILDWPDCVRLQLLERDLESLSVVIHPDEFSQFDADCTGHALGLLYVCEGSCIGNQQLYAALKKHRQFVDWGGFAFLSGCKSGFAERWKTTLQLLAEHCRNDINSPQYKNIEMGALAGFNLYGIFWSSLVNSKHALHV